MIIVKYLEESGLLIKAVSETIKIEVKEQKDGFLGMLLCILSASLLRSILAGKGVTRGGDRVIRAKEEQLEQVRNFNATSSCN